MDTREDFEEHRKDALVQVWKNGPKGATVFDEMNHYRVVFDGTGEVMLFELEAEYETHLLLEGYTHEATLRDWRK